MSSVRIRLPLPYGPLVKRLRHRPFTAVTWVRFPHGSPKKSRHPIGCLLFFDVYSPCGNRKPDPACRVKNSPVDCFSGRGRFCTGLTERFRALRFRMSALFCCPCGRTGSIRFEHECFSPAEPERSLWLRLAYGKKTQNVTEAALPPEYTRTGHAAKSRSFKEQSLRFGYAEPPPFARGRL